MRLRHITEGDGVHRVRAVILNKNQLQQIVPAVRSYCKGQNLESPGFILVSRQGSDEAIREFDLDSKYVTSDWQQAAKFALEMCKLGL